ncbi:hypothetical protein [Metabacillus indicus]|uniref:hypothetical protein n=1 Tax=Metabacillus indicus TaxID=246786 RepID=UPI003CEBB709
MFKDVAELVKAPRTLHLRFPYGSPVGHPNQEEQQIKVLTEAFDLLVNVKEAGIIKTSNIKYRSEI